LNRGSRSRAKIWNQPAESGRFGPDEKDKLFFLKKNKKKTVHVPRVAGEPDATGERMEERPLAGLEEKNSACRSAKE